MTNKHTPLFQDNLGKLAAEKLNQSGDDGVAVASAGPFANHLYLVPAR